MLEERELWLDLKWVPREDNTLADELTNEDFGHFRMENRVLINVRHVARNSV